MSAATLTILMIIFVMIVMVTVILSAGRRAPSDQGARAERRLQPCPHCGYLNSEKAHYCGQCGTDLDTAAP